MSELYLRVKCSCNYEMEARATAGFLQTPILDTSNMSFCPQCNKKIVGGKK